MDDNDAEYAPPPCPRCHAGHVVRNGSNRSGTPGLPCRGCGRRFVDSPRKGPAGDERKALVLRLLAERMAIRAIARVTGPVAVLAAALRQRPAPRAGPAAK